MKDSPTSNKSIIFLVFFFLLVSFRSDALLQSSNDPELLCALGALQHRRSLFRRLSAGTSAAFQGPQLWKVVRYVAVEVGVIHEIHLMILVVYLMRISYPREVGDHQRWLIKKHRHFSPLIDRCLPTDIPLSMVPYCHDWRWRDDCIWESGVAWCDMPCSYAGALAGRLGIWSPNWAARVLGGWLFGPKLWPSFLKRIGHFVWVEHFNKMTGFSRPGGRFSFSNLTVVCGVTL